MKLSRIFVSISLIVIFSMLAGLTTSTAHTTQSVTLPESAANEPGLSYRYAETLGETGVPYLEDSAHINFPWGVGTDGTNIWIGEVWSSRALKFASDGTFLMQIGTANSRATQNIFQIHDVGVDSAGNIYVVDGPANHIVIFDAAGNKTGELGVMWDCSTANDRFCNPRSIAFDASGNIYVPESGNSRIQILDSTGGWIATLGGVRGSGDYEFIEPEHLAIYADQLYVADSGNQRIQIFDISTPTLPTYLATIGVTGEPGPDNDHLACPTGVSIDDLYIYIADSCNNRIQIFDRALRTYFATVGTGEGQGDYEFVLPTDVAVDAAGNVYVADYNNTRVQQFDSDWVYARTYGTTNVPYVTDGYHYNIPLVSTDADDNILITEEWGHRLIKLDPDGNFLWSVGTPGMAGWDNEHFSAPVRPAADSSGNIYVPESWNSRVQIFSPEGTYLSTLGSYGQGDLEFTGPQGVAIGSNDYIYVADRGNERVQVIDISNPITPTYVTTIGETGVCDVDNDHLCRPTSVALDTAGNIYIADSDNYRIQKFDDDFNYLMTIGTGLPGFRNDQFGSPVDVVVDAQGRIFVSDAPNNRVQVLDPSGGYLTTIGGAWGTNSSQFIYASSVAVDSKGNVYISDQQNSRIQKFSPGVLGWKQVNINGFGSPYAGVASLEIFGGQLYAGTGDWVDGGQVWRTSNGRDWSAASEPGFSSEYTTTNRAIIDMLEFKGQLYAGTGWGGLPGQIWRSPDGTTWEPITTDGFGNINNTAITSFFVFSDTLYAAAGNVVDGFEIWSSITGDSLSWTPVVTGGLGYPGNEQLTNFTLFDGFLYLATEGTQPVQVWRSADGTTWDPIVTDGFGDPNNLSTGGYATLDGYLYLGTLNQETGAQLWRSSDGAIWEPVIEDGFGDPDNVKIESLFTFNGHLYAGTQNNETGLEIWRSFEGLSWGQINPDGFGDSNNYATLWSNATIDFRNYLYIGTWNNGNGGEIWELLSPIYLPLIRR